MLQLKENKLTISKAITNADTIIKLTSDINCDISALVTLADNSVKVLHFIKENTYYKCRLVFTEEDIQYINKVTMCLILISSTEQRTNTVTVNIDIPKVKQSVKLSKSNDIKVIRNELSKLTTLVNDVLNNKVVYKTNLNIKQSNIKQGMIPVVINEEGLCMFKYPFIDVITEINGQKTVNNAILLTAKDIPTGTSSNVEATLREHTEAMKSLTAYLDTISTELKTVKKKLADVEQKVLIHTESSLI